MSTSLRRYSRGYDQVSLYDGLSGTPRFYHYDHQGTTQCLTDNTGKATDRFASDAWGVEVRRTGSSVNRHWYIGSFGYTADCAHTLYVRNRYLKVLLSRWMTVEDTFTEASSYNYPRSPVTDVVPEGEALVALPKTKFLNLNIGGGQSADMLTMVRPHSSPKGASVQLFAGISPGIRPIPPSIFVDPDAPRPKCANDPPDKRRCKDIGMENCHRNCPWGAAWRLPTFVSGGILNLTVGAKQQALALLRSRRGKCSSISLGWSTGGKCDVAPDRPFQCTGSHETYSCRQGKRIFVTSIMCCPFCIEGTSLTDAVSAQCCTFSPNHPLP